MNEQTALQEAVEIIGGQSKTAKICGVTSGMVWQWLNAMRPLSPDHCPALEVATAAAGDRIRCEELRPDIDWTRDKSGQITGYHVPIVPPDLARRTTATSGGDAAETVRTPVSLEDAA